MNPLRTLAALGGALAAALLLTLLPAQSPSSADEELPLEDYARYDPQSRCSPKAKPGTTMLSRWIVWHYDGGYGPISRACKGKSISEHKEGRAFDWTLDATRSADRARAKRFLGKILLNGPDGETDVLARRMGIMYVIWNDRIYSAWNHFVPRRYLSSGCKSVRKCSKTLRHRDHMHISLSRRAGAAKTSWYVARKAKAS